MDATRFYAGIEFDAQEFMGAHTYYGGTRFTLWAPAARSVSVVVDKTADSTEADWYEMHRTPEGFWQADCPGVNAGMYYKYHIDGADGVSAFHCDPYGTAMAPQPDARSIVTDLGWEDFDDDEWMQTRTRCYDRPLSIYEVHAGSWRQKPDGSCCSYDELAELLPAYCKKNGYTHIELMPLAEYPFDGSWGYQPIGFFAPTSRYGTPAGLCRFVNACHKAGIGVILDFVPVHFATDSYGLCHLDGTALYEYPHVDVGVSEWGSYNFMHSHPVVRSFLQSCANYWLRHFHADGLRVDAVSRLLYWQGDPARGANADSVNFVRTMNSGLHALHPTAILIAEDSSNYPGVTAPADRGGLDFDYKWDLGWMNDTLDFFKKTPEERIGCLQKITFSMMYYWQERYLLPFSHDENVHGKATILQKMWGDYEIKFPQGRLLYLYMMTHPGKKLDFMGNEIGQLREWDETREQDWLLMRYPIHDAFFRYRVQLQKLYRDLDALWAMDYSTEGFSWLDCDRPETGMFALTRTGYAGRVLAAFNFSDRTVDSYTLPVSGKFTLLLNTDWESWGGAAPVPAKPPVQKANTFAAQLAPFSGQLWLWEPEEAGSISDPENTGAPDSESPAAFGQSQEVPAGSPDYSK